MKDSKTAPAKTAPDLEYWQVERVEKKPEDAAGA